ncbi:hypothetical protein Tco_0829959 [Tanacetum coccineum]
MKAIIKEQVKAQVSKIMPKIEKYVTESLGAEVLVRSTNKPQASYAVATSLSEFELKKILIDKIETNKLINRSDIQKNLYNILVEAYNSDKDIITSYGDVSTQAKEPEFEAADTVMQQDQGSSHIDDQPDNEASPKHDWFQKPDNPRTPNRAWNKSKSIDFRPPQKWISTIAKARQPPHTFDELMGTPIDFSAYVMNRLKIDKLTQEILVRPAFNLLKGSCKSFTEHEYHFEEFPVKYFINNDLEYLKGGSLSSKYATSLTRTKATKYDNVEGIEDMKSPHDVYSKRRIIAVTSVKVMRWYDYGYFEEIIVRREDKVLYKFKEGEFPRLNLYDIEDMLLLLVQKKLSNLDMDDQYDLGVALGMFTRHIVILQRVEDLQLGVESYQKKLNITRPEITKSNISKLTPYTAYKNP